MGGLIAAHYAAKYPARVEHLVLCGPARFACVGQVRERERERDEDEDLNGSTRGSSAREHAGDRRPWRRRRSRRLGSGTRACHPASDIDARVPFLCEVSKVSFPVLR